MHESSDACFFTIFLRKLINIRVGEAINLVFVNLSCTDGGSPQAAIHPNNAASPFENAMSVS